MEKTQSFTEGRIFSPLIRFSLPVFLALLLQALYGAVDLLIVGKFGGEFADVYQSAVSTGSQIMQTITFVITGLAMGITVYVGEKIGAKQREEAGKIIGSGIFLFGVVAIVLTVVLMLTSPALSKLMQAPAEAYNDTVVYMLICSSGMIFVVAYNILGSIFRGIGDSNTPLISVAIACVFNILGDLLFVAVFHMGAAGAAIATTLAQGISVLLSFLVIRKKELPFGFSAKYIRPNRSYIKTMLKLGAPIAIQDLLSNASFLVISAIVNSLGLIVSAAVGVASKTFSFLLLVPSAFMQSMSAFVAQNMGAEKPDRAKKALWYGMVSSLVAGLVMGYFAFFHAELLASVFAESQDVIVAAGQHLQAYGIDCVLAAFLFSFMGYFNGCGKTTFVMLQSISCAFLIRLPVSWIMSKQVPVSLFNIGLAIPAATAVQVLLCVGFFIFMSRKQKQTTSLERN